MNGIEFGKITKREKDLLFHLGNCLAEWIENNKTERGELLCVLTILCHLMFAKQTPITDKEKQCDEVDAFCECLKLRIREDN
jgi:hypothetical protein